MSSNETHVNEFKEWVETLREDIEAVKAVVENDKADDEARKFAAAGLLYLVARMDLVPDWEESVGVLDDVMVLRVLTSLAVQLDHDKGLESGDLVKLGRLANEADRVETYLGDEHWARFRKYCSRLTDQQVRGLSPSLIVADSEARAGLYDRIEDELKRMPAAAFADPEKITLRFKNYLHHKLAK